MCALHGGGAVGAGVRTSALSYGCRGAGARAFKPCHPAVPGHGGENAEKSCLVARDDGSRGSMSLCWVCVLYAGRCFDLVRLYDGPFATQTPDSPLLIGVCGNQTASLPDPFVLGPNAYVTAVNLSTWGRRVCVQCAWAAVPCVPLCGCVGTVGLWDTR
jgi:hypothetical protein